MGNSRHDLSIPKDYFMKDKAKLLYVSSSTYGGDWISTPHTHYCSELFYVLDGVGQFQVEDRIFPVSANDLVIINPNVSHTELGFHANPLKYIVLGIENLELSVANEGENFCIVSFREIKETMNFYLKMMLREIETRAPGYEAVCQDLMEILIVLFGRQTNFKTILTPTNKKSSHLCESVRRYIDANCSEDISLEQLAQFSHVNKYYLVHAFQRVRHFSDQLSDARPRRKKRKPCFPQQTFPSPSSAAPAVFPLPAIFPRPLKSCQECPPAHFAGQAGRTRQLRNKCVSIR